MIEHIAWDDKYKVGHPMIDSQHQHLFELADKLYNVLDAGVAWERSHVEQLLQECAEYILFHFSSEESLMDEVEYEGAARKNHLGQHRDFNLYVSGLLGKFFAGEAVNLGELYSFIANWLVQHIVLEDKKLGEQVRIFLYGE